MPKTTTFSANNPLTANDLNKLVQDSQIVQTTGTSTTDVMSQKATTDAINNKIKLNSSTSTTANLTMYAPTSAGASGNILRSNGSGAPSWYSPDSANLVTKTGTQTISGAKTFTAVTTQFNNILLKNGSDNDGCKLNFGDGDYVHISEPEDDIMELKAGQINLIGKNDTNRTNKWSMKVDGANLQFQYNGVIATSLNKQGYITKVNSTKSSSITLTNSTQVEPYFMHIIKIVAQLGGYYDVHFFPLILSEFHGGNYYRIVVSTYSAWDFTRVDNSNGTITYKVVRGYDAADWDGYIEGVWGVRANV